MIIKTISKTLLALAVTASAIGDDLVISQAITATVDINGNDSISLTEDGSIITLSGDAITLSNGAINGSIVNDGTIIAANAGINIENSPLNNGIVNNGSITSGTSNQGGFLALSGVVINGDSLTGGLTNTGTINSTTVGVSIAGEGFIDSINNAQSGVITGSFAGLNLQNATAGSIENAGLISGAFFEGITLFNDAVITGDINNSGTINSTASGARGAIFLQGETSVITGVINNTGTLSADTVVIPFDTPLLNILTGAPALSPLLTDLSDLGDTAIAAIALPGQGAVINIGSGSVGGIINSAGAVIDNAAFASNSAAPAIEVTTGNLGFVTNAGVINGTIEFGANGGTFNAKGGSSGAVRNVSTLNIQLSDNATSDTITTISSDFSFSGPISLDTKGLGGTSTSQTISGVLNVDGAVDITGSSLNINVSGENFIANGQQLAFISGTSLLNDISTASDNSNIVDFSIAQQGNTLVATAVRTAFEEVLAQSPAGAQVNAQAVSGSLTTVTQQIQAGAVAPDSELGGVINSITALGSLDDMVAAIKTLEPEATNSGAVGAISADSAAAGAVNLRLANLRGTGFSGAVAGDALSLNGFWIQLYDSNTDQDTIDEVDGFDADTHGIALGIDAALNERYNVGIAFSFADTDLDSNGAENNSLEIESYRLTAYGSFNTPEYFLDAQVAYSRNQYDSVRNIFDGSSNGLRALSDYNGDQYSLRARIGKPLAFDNGIFLTLKGSAEYTYLREDSHSEKNAGNAGLTIDADKVDAFVLGAGVDIAYPITTANEITWVPELRLELQYDFIGEEIEVDSNFIGVSAAAFTTQGANVEQNGISAGLGLRAFNQGNLSVSLRADYLYKKDYRNVSGGLFLRYGF